MYDTSIPNDTEYLANGLETYGFEFLVHNDWHGSIVWYKPKDQFPYVGGVPGIV